MPHMSVNDVTADEQTNTNTSIYRTLGAASGALQGWSHALAGHASHIAPLTLVPRQ
jgi:hypothetical protein